MSRVAVLTVAHGRHDHLRRQEESLARSTRRPDVRVVVAVDDPGITGPAVVALEDGGPLPMAAARNLAATTARERGADALVFLDVDCVVLPSTVGAFADAVAERPLTVWSGPVTYLPPGEPTSLDRLPALDAPHPARPCPAPGTREREDRWELFWSLSFAVSAVAWQRLGGFDEAYRGYGAEDTDLGQRAAAAGLSLAWDGDARAYHQHHPVSDPPVEHVADIVRNGRLFHERWGWWPMGGWLDAFEERGLVRRDGDDWRLTSEVLGAPLRG